MFDIYSMWLFGFVVMSCVVCCSRVDFFVLVFLVSSSVLFDCVVELRNLWSIVVFWL